MIRKHNIKSLAVVGVLIVLMTGIGLRLLDNTEEDREKIEIAERFINGAWLQEKYGQYSITSLTFPVAKVTQDSDFEFTVEGNAVFTYSEESYTTVKPIRVLMNMKDGEWRLEGIYSSDNESFWDRIKEYVISFLP